MLNESLYLGRDTRLNYLPQGTNEGLLNIWGEQGAADAGLDRILVSRWLADKTRMTPDMTRDMLPELTKQYFGEELDPTQAYDRIVNEGRKQREGMARLEAFQKAQEEQMRASEEQPEAKPLERDKEKYAGWQAPRALVSGFSEYAQSIPAGLASLGATVTSFGMPVKFDPSQDAEAMAVYGRYATLRDERITNSILTGTFLPKTREELETEAQVTGITRMVSDENRKALEAWEQTAMGSVSDGLRYSSQFWREVSSEMDEMVGVDPAFAESGFGQFTKTMGSMPATMALMAIGGTGLVALGSGQFDAVEQERMAFEGDAYDPRRALFGNFISAAGQTAVERIIRMDDVLANALKLTPKTGGKFVFKEFMGNARKQMIIAGVGEGLEEMTQGQWNDMVARYTYDEQRFDSLADVAAQRFWEGMAGMAGGMLMGGGVSLVQAGDMEINRRKGRRYLSNRNGTLFTPEDFKHTRAAFSDADLLGMTEGRMLLEAVNGNEQAQNSYNAIVAQGAFVPTEGAQIASGRLGTVDGKPALYRADGAVTIFDLNKEADAQAWQMAQAMAVAAKERQEFANEAADTALATLQARFGDVLEVSRPDFLPTLREMIANGEITEQAATDALDAAKAVNALAADITLDTASPQGRATIRRDDVAKVTRMMADVVKGVTPDVAIEEVAESWVQKGIADQQLTHDELTGLRAEWQTANNQTDPTAGGKVTAERANIEWFSNRVIEYAVAGKHADVTGKWWRWIRLLGDKVKGLISGAKQMRAQMEAGTLNPRLEELMRGALGLEASRPMDGTQAGPTGAGGQTFSLAQTETPAFRRWFGASKVVDGQGNPLVVYRGEWKVRDGLREGREIYFSDSPAIASAYSEPSTQGGSANVIPAFLSFQNPVIVDAKGADWNPVVPLALQEARAEGRDGVIVRNVIDGLGETTGQQATTYIALDPRQVKSAIVNRGTFDPASPDITFRLAPKVDHAPLDSASYDAFLAYIDKAGIYTLYNKGLEELARERNMTELSRRRQATIDQRARGKGAAFFDAVTAPIDYVLGKISPDLARRLRQRTFDANTQTVQDHATVDALFNLMNERGIPERDLLAFDQALLQGDEDVARSVARAYQFEPQLDAVLGVLERQRQRSLELGVPVLTYWNRPTALEGAEYTAFQDALALAKARPRGEAGIAIEEALRRYGYELNVPFYWPRRVFDRDGLLVALRGFGVENVLEEEMRKAEAKAGGDPLTEEQIDAIAQRVNQAVKARQFEGGGGKPGSLKQRQVNTVTAALMPFYVRPKESVLTQIERMNDYLETLDFFGASVVLGEQDELTGFAAPINVKDSVGKYIAALALEGKMDNREFNAVRDALVARFNFKQSPGYIQGLRALSYLQNMTQIYSFITASFPDMFAATFEGGIVNAGASFARALTNASKVKIGEIGEAERRISEEFSGSAKGMERYLGNDIPSTLNRWLNWMFRNFGMTYFTRVMKETVINSAVESLSDAAARGQLTTAQKNRLYRTFGEEGGARVMADLQEGRVTDDVKFYAFNTLADWQPISLDQMPTAYLSSPSGRIFYMYKSFMVTQVAGIRRFAIDEIIAGGREGDMQRVANGVATLGYIMALIVAAGLPVDALIALITGRQFSLSDTAASRLMGVVMLNRYSGHALLKGDIDEALVSTFIPSFSGLPKDAIGDALRVYDAARLGVEVDFTKLALWRNAPILGRTYDHRFGGSAAKNEEAREDAGGWFTLTGPDTDESRSDDARRRALEKYFGNE